LATPNVKLLLKCLLLGSNRYYQKKIFKKIIKKNLSEFLFYSKIINNCFQSTLPTEESAFSFEKSFSNNRIMKVFLGYKVAGLLANSVEIFL